jgi:hypothetical protein
MHVRHTPFTLLHTLALLYTLASLEQQSMPAQAVLRWLVSGCSAAAFCSPWYVRTTLMVISSWAAVTNTAQHLITIRPPIRLASRQANQMVACAC